MSVFLICLFSRSSRFTKIQIIKFGQQWSTLNNISPVYPKSFIYQKKKNQCASHDFTLDTNPFSALDSLAILLYVPFFKILWIVHMATANDFDIQHIGQNAAQVKDQLNETRIMFVNLLLVSRIWLTVVIHQLLGCDRWGSSSTGCTCCRLHRYKLLWLNICMWLTPSCSNVSFFPAVSLNSEWCDKIGWKINWYYIHRKETPLFNHTNPTDVAKQTAQQPEGVTSWQFMDSESTLSCWSFSAGSH